MCSTFVSIRKKVEPRKSVVSRNIHELRYKQKIPQKQEDHMYERTCKKDIGEAEKSCPAFQMTKSLSQSRCSLYQKYLKKMIA